MADDNQPVETPYQDDPSQPPPDQEEPAPPAQSTSIHIRHLTLVSVSLSLASFIIGIIFSILSGFGENHGAYLPWQFRDVAGWLIFVIILTVLISSLNAYRLQHGRPLPIPINMFFDLVIAITAICSGIPAIVAMGEMAQSGCSTYYYHPPSCQPWRLAVSITGIVGLSLVIIFGIVHVILLIVRTKTAYQRRIWRRPWSFVSLPNGQFTVEFSLKMYRKPEPTVGQQHAQAERENESEALV